MRPELVQRRAVLSEVVRLATDRGPAARPLPGAILAIFRLDDLLVRAEVDVVAVHVIIVAHVLGPMSFQPTCEHWLIGSTTGPV